MKGSLSATWKLAGSLLILLLLLISLGWLEAPASLIQMEKSLQAPNASHWLGTDFFGRDIFARGLHGLKLATLVGGGSALLSLGLGLFFGLAAGRLRGWLDTALCWIANTLESIPYLLLLAMLSWSIGQGLQNLVIALGLTSWVLVFRLTRAEVQRQSELSYMQATQALGFSSGIQIIRHLLPNVSHICRNQFPMQMMAAIKYEVILSFVGLGAEPGTPSWGVMIYDAKDELLLGHWYGLFWASLLLFCFVLSLSFLARAHAPAYKANISAS